MAEGARLESVYTGNRIVGSNPTPSAIHIEIIKLFLTIIVISTRPMSDMVSGRTARKARPQGDGGQHCK